MIIWSQTSKLIKVSLRSHPPNLSSRTFVTLPNRTMPPKGSTKRKAPPPSSSNGVANGTSSQKKPRTHSDPLRKPHPFHEEAEEHGIVLSQFYPHEMSNARAKAYNEGEIPRPIEQVNSALAGTREARKKISVGGAVVHWFKMDLRTRDNRALSQASETAREAGVPLIGLYVLSPQDFEAHLRSPVRVDFMLRSLESLKQDLTKLDIPLWVETVEKRKEIPDRILGLVNEWGATHLFANLEYEVDELRREATLVKKFADNGVCVELVHDTCVVPPGPLTSGTGKQYAVYTPWFRTWVRYLHDNPDLLELSEPPQKNPESARERFGKLFDCTVPQAPESKQLSTEEVKRFKDLWPAGEQHALKRLEQFCENKIGEYAIHRNFPDTEGTSSISVHLAAGTLSARTAVCSARDRNKTKRLDGGDDGIQTWISEVAWRDFYRHVLVNWPYVWYVILRLFARAK